MKYRIRNSILLAACLLGAWEAARSANPGGTGVAAVGASLSDLSGKVMTVNGPVGPRELGVTLTYEHVFANFDDPRRTPPSEPTRLQIYQQPLTIELLGPVLMGYRNRDNLLLADEETAIDELLEFKMRGSKTIVEVTSIGLGRDPLALKRVANATGLYIIAGSGWYHQDLYPLDIDERSVESLTDEIVRDVSSGIGDTGVHAGIIGALRIESDSLTANEVKVLQAAGRASRMTGAAVSVSFRADAGLQVRQRVLALIEAEGADPKRVILGRSDTLVRDPAALRGLLELGAYVQFDGLGEYSPLLRRPVTDHHVAQAIVELIKAGFGDRLLLSQGVDSKIALRAFGGRGYTYVGEIFVPHLRELGATQAQIDTMIEANPQRVLTLVPAQVSR